MSFMLKHERLCMPTYFRTLRPAKTESGSEDSWLLSKERDLWGGGRKPSGLHSFAIAAPLRVRQCVCARVSVSVLYKCVLTSTSIEHTHHNGHRYANAGNMPLHLLAYTHIEKSKHKSMLKMKDSYP